MHPILFRAGSIVVRSAGAMYVLAVVVAGLWALRVARRRGWKTEDILPGLTLVVIAAYTGARLYGAVVHGATLGGGSAPLGFLGGLALGGATLLGYLKWRGLPVGEVMDELAPIAPMVYAIFRFGCLLNGDDYGTPATVPWAMRFPKGTPPMNEPVHPTQLYEMLLMVPVFVWVWLRRSRPHAPGAIAFELCMLMGAERFIADFWRDWDRSMPLSSTQWLALGLVVLGAIGRLQVTKRNAVA